MTVLNHTGRSNEKLVYYDPYIFFFKILSLSNYSFSNVMSKNSFSNVMSKYFGYTQLKD